MGRFPTYVVTMVALDLLGLSLATGLFPPNTVTQLYALGATLVAAPFVSYWLVYRDGFEHFQLRRLRGRRDDEREGRRGDDGKTDEN